MVVALLLGLGIFASCWFLHVIVWRIHRPAAYPIWLPIVFVLVPIAAVMALATSDVQFPFLQDLPTVLAAFLLHFAISACYMGGYAGIIEYSPSAEILRVVKAAMPAGIAPDELEVPSLTEQALTGKRIQHLMDSGMAVEADGNLTLTDKGAGVVRLCQFYRNVFGLKEPPKG